METDVIRGQAIAVAAGIALSLFATAPAAAAPADLESVVAEQLLGQTTNNRADLSTADESDARITVTEEADGWAFGTAVIVAEKKEDAMPEGRLFLAKRTGKGWQVSFDSDAAFVEMSKTAPVLSKEERERFSPTAGLDGDVSVNATDLRTQMALPWAVGQTWTMTGGPHPWGSSGAYASMDFAGGDQVVRAMRSGTAYTMCTGWVRVIHGNGYATDYYHLWSNISANGTPVSQGTYLGYTGTDVTCGGSATGRHVHIGFRINNAYASLAQYAIGKWVPNAGAAYGGYMLHGSYRVNPGGGVYNYGALGLTQGFIDANGGGTVNQRTGPGTGYAVAGSVADGATVTVSCSATGTSHTGRYGTSNLWNKLSNGRWIADVYLWTGVSNPVNGWC
ncbi:peptidoglycan DD-metalloendopeptidase family protein [Stackebrandtia soli]|uniref:peptidoglycan DD-metalloendopeptidase family protein n=1 Tax=Stackebrandtia soli TaxID=1892856 RepID=UPI0039ECF87A